MLAQTFLPGKTRQWSVTDLFKVWPAGDISSHRVRGFGTLILGCRGSSWHHFFYFHKYLKVNFKDFQD
jgi:hypothetical protein